MPELKEVFEIVSQKVEPDRDAWNQQEQRQRSAMRGRRIGAYAVVAALLAVAAVVAVTSWPDRPPTDGVGDDHPSVPSTASGRFFLDLKTGATRPLPDGIPHGSYYAISPDGTMVATNPCCDGSDPVFVANVDGTDVRQITESPMDGYGPRWSPDGSMLAFQGRNGATSELGDLFVVDVATGDRTRITNLEPNSYDPWFLSPSFTADGRSILFQLPRGPGRTPAAWDLWSVPIAGGEPTLVWRDASLGAYAPNGRSLAYLDPSRGEWASATLLLEGDSAPHVIAEGARIEFPRWFPDGTRIAYVDSGAVHVVDIATRQTSRVADGSWAEWFDEDTLVIS